MIPSTEKDTIALAELKAITYASYGKVSEGADFLQAKVDHATNRAQAHATAVNVAIAQAWHDAAHQYSERYLPCGSETPTVGGCLPRCVKD